MDVVLNRTSDVELRKKFDMQLAQSAIDEERLAGILGTNTFEKAKFIELKTERWQWEQTGNICVELASSGQRSGLMVTTADYWFHELAPYGSYLVFPTATLKDLVFQRGRACIRKKAGDNGKSDVSLISLGDLVGFKRR